VNRGFPKILNLPLQRSRTRTPVVRNRKQKAAKQKYESKKIKSVDALSGASTKILAYP
jgi:hypothetical protein